MPADVLSKSDMEDVLVDYHIAKAMADNLSSDERYKQALYLDYVFEKNGTTEEAFNHSIEWYSRNTEDFAKIYEKVNKRLSSQRSEISELIAASGEDEQQQSETGDTVNVWHKQKIYKLTKATATNKFYFTIYPDSNYKERDILLWSIRCTFISAKKHPEDAVMSLNIKYINDSIISETRNIVRSGKYNIRLQNDSACRIKEIKGFVYYNQLSHYQQDALIVDNISLTRYHVKNGTKSGMKALPVSNADSLKRDSTKKQEIIQETNQVGNDSLNRNVIKTSGPRRRSVKARNNNDVRIFNNQQIQKPQGIRR